MQENSREKQRALTNKKNKCENSTESELILVDDLYCVLTGKPGDSLPVKRKPEKLIQLKRKVCVS